MRGRDIKRYGYDFADLWIIVAKFGSFEYLEMKYPAIYSHLLEHKDKLVSRGQCKYTSSGKINKDKPYPGQHHWLELDNNPCDNYLDDFSKQKIIWGEISDKPKFAIDENGDYFVANTVFMLTGENLHYLLAVLNSKLSEYYFSQIATTTGVGTVRWLKYKVELLPIPKLETVDNELLSKIDFLFNQNDFSSESIDEIIYKIYSFTNEEICYINNIIA
ncbi:MAG: TaqI-like C-terminal specificity domain-containing protein [Oscillospiraceae bacterium]